MLQRRNRFKDFNGPFIQALGMLDHGHGVGPGRQHAAGSNPVAMAGPDRAEGRPAIAISPLRFSKAGIDSEAPKVSWPRRA